MEEYNGGEGDVNELNSTLARSSRIQRRMEKIEIHWSQLMELHRTLDFTSFQKKIYLPILVSESCMTVFN